MIFRTHIPSFPLCNFIEHFFYYEGYNPEHNIDRLLPDGNTEMIIDLTGQPKYIYDNDTLQAIQTCQKVWVSGIKTAPISIPSGKESRMIVITFKKGRAFPFFSFPLTELTDYVVNADLIYGRPVVELRERLLESHSIKKMFEYLEQYFLMQAGEKLHPTIESKCIDFALNAVESNATLPQLNDLSTKIGYSQKHFINLFKKHAGITPKNFMRILRFQRVIQEIEVFPSVDWSSIAFNCGFYDQAHLINEFKRFSGFTPRHYLHSKSELLNYIPVQ